MDDGRVRMVHDFCAASVTGYSAFSAGKLEELGLHEKCVKALGRRKGHWKSAKELEKRQGTRKAPRGTRNTQRHWKCEKGTGMTEGALGRRQDTRNASMH